MCLTKALFTYDTHWTTKFLGNVIIMLTSRRCQYCAKKTHILSINKGKKTGKDIKENKSVLKATCGCNTSFKI